MKRKLFSFIMACLLLTGCESIRIENITQNIEAANNYNTSITLEINGKIDNNIIDFKRIRDIKVDNTNSSALINNIDSINDIKVEETYYSKLSNNMVTIYKPYSDYYQYTTYDKSNSSIYYISSIINENSKYQYIDSKDGIMHYVLIINKQSVSNFINSYSEVDFLNDLDYEINSDAKINVFIDSNTKQIVSLNIDLASIMKFNNEDDNLDRFYLEVNYSNYNSSGNVVIPKDIVSKAVDNNAIKAYNDALKYVDIVNNLSLSNDLITFTNNSLSYEGIKPTLVNLVLLYGKVISGNILINNYEIKVESGVVSSPNNIKQVE